MAGDWTIKRCLDWSRDYLRDKGVDRPRFMAEALLSHVTGMGRIDMYMNLDRPLSRDELGPMHEALVRTVKGEPLQLIVGDTQFRTITVACERGVLIPRPETELLVEEVLNFLDRDVWGLAPGEAFSRARAVRSALPWNDEVEAARRAEEQRRAQETERAATPAARDYDPSEAYGAASPDDLAADGISYEPVAAAGQAGLDPMAAAPAPAPQPAPTPRIARVLEVGTGTGCIPLSIATERAGAVSCVAVDVDPHAVDLAARNRASLGLGPDAVDIRQGDLFDPVSVDERGMFDVLVSNPPYIPNAVMGTLPANVVGYDPDLALRGGADGLDVFRRLLAGAPSMLRPGGLFACELHETTLGAAADLCREQGLADVRVVRDLAGRPRIVTARRPA